MRIGFPRQQCGALVPQIPVLVFLSLAFESCQGGELNIFYPFVYKKLEAKVPASLAVLRVGLFSSLMVFAFPQLFPELFQLAGMKWRGSLVAGTGHRILCVCGWSPCTCYTCLLLLSLDGGQASQ